MPDGSDWFDALLGPREQTGDEEIKEKEKIKKQRGLSKEELQEEIKTFPGTFTEWLEKYSEPDCSDFDLHKDVWDEARGISFSMRGDDIEAHIFKAKNFDLNFKYFNEL